VLRTPRMDDVVKPYIVVAPHTRIKFLLVVARAYQAMSGHLGNAGSLPTFTTGVDILTMSVHHSHSFRSSDLSLQGGKPVHG
jgi:hypothetical protein